MSANNDKSIETIDSIETYAYGMSKDIAKEEIKCSNIMKQWIDFMTVQVKVSKNIIPIGSRFLIIHTK